MSRDFGYYWLRLVIYIIVTICIGSIYLNIGTGYSAILVQSDFSLGSPRIQWFVRINHLLIDVYSVFSSFLEPPWFLLGQSRGSCAAFVFGFVTFMSIGGFPSFVEDMKVRLIRSKLRKQKAIHMENEQSWNKFAFSYFFLHQLTCDSPCWFFLPWLPSSLEIDWNYNAQLSENMNLDYIKIFRFFRERGWMGTMVSPRS